MNLCMQGLPGETGEPGSPGEAGPVVRPLSVSFVFVHISLRFAAAMIVILTGGQIVTTNNICSCLLSN